MKKIFKVSDIKNMDLFIKGIDYVKYENFMYDTPSYVDDSDFKMGYELAKRINSSSYKKQYMKCK